MINMEKTIVVFGSISITTLPQNMKEFLLQKCNKDFTFFIGDANGADTVIQQYLDDIMANTVVHYIGNKPRNYANGFNFSQFKVDGTSFIQKDIHMCKWTKEGCGLWDMKSKGSKRNIDQLKFQNKDITLFIN